jgi:AcrR family transcriptional regulator
MGEAGQRARDRKSEAMRERILAAATDLLAREGYAALRVAAVAKEARVSLGGQLHHFPTKEALVIAVLERLAERSLAMAQRQAAEMPPDADPLEWMAECAARLYAAPEFLINLDIYLSARRHTLVGERAVEILISQRAATEAMWLPALVSLGLEEEQALPIIRAIWALSRGLAISSAPTDPEAGEGTVTELVLRALKLACLEPGKAPPSRSMD